MKTRKDTHGRRWGTFSGGWLLLDVNRLDFISGRRGAWQVSYGPFASDVIYATLDDAMAACAN